MKYQVMTRRIVEPQTSSKPLPTPLAMSAAPMKPTSSPLPLHFSSDQNANTADTGELAIK